MKKIFKSFVLLLLLLIAFGVNNAFCDTKIPLKVAVVDFDFVAKNSAKFNNLKKYQAQKTKELQTFMVNAAKEVENETDANKKKELKEKLNNEYKNKKAEIEQHYIKEVAEIDNLIERKVKDKAKSAGYDLVLTKKSVLYGGDDITYDIQAEIK